MALGWGEISFVSEMTGLSRSTVSKGAQEIKNPSQVDPDRVRQQGGGRKPLELVDLTLKADLLKLVAPDTCGDPQSPLQYTSKSIRHLTVALQSQGHHVSTCPVQRILHEEEYSLQGNRKTKEGSDHPDRNGQFEHVAASIQEFQTTGQPVISVDTKKKELVGEFKNPGKEYRPKASPRPVKMYDFPDSGLGRAVPYGIYDLAQDHGFVNVGQSADTAPFACESIRQWWEQEGKLLYPEATALLITADGGGSNGSRVRAWKIELQKITDETGLAISVCHYPPGTSKWNKIEHHLFSPISANWRAEPLESYDKVVQLIAHTTTTKGLTVTCRLDTNTYAKGVKISDKQLAEVNITRHSFHGEWNHTISPTPKRGSEID